MNTLDPVYDCPFCDPLVATAASVGKMNDRVSLVLEDKALIAVDVGDALAEKGFFVATAASNKAKRQWLADNPSPDVAIIDVGLAAELTALGVPMVVHSARPGPVMPEDEAFAEAVWINDPSYSDDILDAVETAVRNGKGRNPSPVERP